MHIITVVPDESENKISNYNLILNFNNTLLVGDDNLLARIPIFIIITNQPSWSFTLHNLL